VVGQKLQDHQEDGRIIDVTVTDVSQSTVTLDANHPLAGKNLIFDIQLVEIL
jgi:FKBP-type peptidyl-prolyl cis-trans isomerase 2